MEVDRGVCRLPAKPIRGNEGCLTAAAASSWAGVAGVAAGEQTIYNTPLKAALSHSLRGNRPHCQRATKAQRKTRAYRTCDCAQARPVDLGELWHCTHTRPNVKRHLRGAICEAAIVRRTIRVFSPASLVRSRHGERVQLACVRHCEASTDGRACLSRAPALEPRQAEGFIRGGRTYVRDRLPRRHRHKRLHLL